MINFLHPNFQPSCTCSCLSDDDYPPENLISSDYQKLSRGFMAYSVTRPPIDIIFTLQYQVDVHCIKIWSDIGSLKSTGFEVCVYSERKQNWRKVAACTNLLENGVVFDWADDDKESPNQFKRCQFYRHYNNRITTKMIKISIKQTKNRCIPVMKKIEIWAQPANICTDAEVQHIKNVWQKVLCGGDISSSNRSRNDSENSTKSSSTTTLEIPDEYIDAITYEIMSLPMILPSGKKIDQSTMIKCNQTDETWGRMPIDPFTGQCFTELRKPIFDAVLKSRIDDFLLRNVHHKETLTIPRTAGIVHNLKRKHNCSMIMPTKLSKIEISKLPRSLDEAVQNALQTITRFSKPNANVMENQQPICFRCQNGFDECLYKIDKCSHFICRKCLIMTNNVSKTDDGGKKLEICDRCGVSFNTCDVKRFYQTKLSALR